MQRPVKNDTDLIASYWAKSRSIHAGIPSDSVSLFTFKCISLL